MSIILQCDGLLGKMAGTVYGGQVKYLGENQADLIMKSPEYKLHRVFFTKLNDGAFESIMNQPIPYITSPLPMASPLSKMPKSLEYNMAHHGILKIDFARGQRQQYDIQPMNGRKFVIGDTNTYYTHNHKVVNFQEYGETHDAYKMYVHSSANYHFAC